MDDSTSSRQIEQMVSFILQEAEEKAREIKFKAEDAATIEKQTLVRKARLRIQEDYEKKESDLDAEKRILMSSAVAKARSRKMKERDVLFQSLQEEAQKDVTRRLGGGNAGSYKTLMLDLLVQGFIAIDEKVVEVRCRAVDASLVNDILPSAVQKYKDLVKAETGAADVALTATVGERRLHPPADGSGNPSCAGGVALLARGSKIVVDNTLDERIRLCMRALQPELRRCLFSTSTTN